MKDYELTIVLPGKFTPAKKKAVQERIEKLIKTFKGSVDKMNDWGVLDLSYKILGNTTGIFLNYDLKLEGKMVREVETKLKMEEDIIRYLLVRKD
ncbi:30S ribosomal protein S6 [Candidatus Woesebacteria bacterium RIFCSPHIGHO2_01_FULL_37_10]|uniref:Small ribosomal subunit protein bS6 n=1 Tax=Candidatus Woesebacteria bacterium RIFCSPHIGHO2_01_FULL_37_10 TaxID=1802489 RepID=A0A1F7XVS8_9BACT|nr:MAG: 30S ribosomal protein S6 [Candidatus Woesebacteria bacterium RIFCSPHIGHO2_01_FULL_37_10]